MKLAYLALGLAACHSASTAPVAHHVAPPAKLGPTVTRDQLASLHAVDAQRVEDGPQAMPVGGTKWITVDANVISALSCRPGGSLPSLVADSRYVYVTFADSRLVMPARGDGAGPMQTPSTYCSYQRFVIPDGLEYGGTLKIVSVR
jgi:hypothetical protein